MATTVAQLIDQISSRLHSFTGRQEATTWVISNPLGTTDTTIFVQHPERAQQGYVEIDDELIQISSNASGQLSVYPVGGRGAQGSVAATHVLNSRVLSNPEFPRVRIFEAIKAAIAQVQPDLFTVATSTTPVVPARTTYELPAAVDRLLKVEVSTIGPSKEWYRVNHWSIDYEADTVTFPSGKSVTIADTLPAGRTIQFTYAGTFTDPVATSDDLVATCKIPTSIHDVLIFNACWRLVQFLPLPRFDMRTVEQQARAGGADPASMMQFAKQMYAAYELRKAEERKRLLQNHPANKHYRTR